MSLAKVSEVSPNSTASHCRNPLIIPFWICFCNGYILDLLVVILANLEGLEDLASFRECYVTESNPGWDLETWVQFKRCQLLTMRVVKLHGSLGASILLSM